MNLFFVPFIHIWMFPQTMVSFSDDANLCLCNLLMMTVDSPVFIHVFCLSIHGLYSQNLQLQMPENTKQFVIEKSEFQLTDLMYFVNVSTCPDLCHCGIVAIHLFSGYIFVSQIGPGETKNNTNWISSNSTILLRSNVFI